MKALKRLRKQRQRRVNRVRKHVRASARGRPRLSVFRSNNHIYAQVIDDETGTTLVAANSLLSDVAGPGKYAGNKTSAEAVGRLVAERSIAKGVKEVVFDRGGYKYHGRVAALAKAAREGGLVF